MKRINSLLTGLTLVICMATAAGNVAHADRSVGLSADKIRAVITKETPKVRRCYAEHAMQQEGADGKVALNLVIRANGNVSEVEVDAPSVSSKEFERCVSQAAKSWKFPRAGGETQVTYPFLFVHTQAPGAGPQMARRGQ